MREGKLATNQELRALVAGKLELEWSPEQIAAWLRETHPDQLEGKGVSAAQTRRVRQSARGLIPQRRRRHGHLSVPA